MNINSSKFHSAILAAACLLVAGCTTHSRLGYLIPANRNSDSSKSEVVRIDFIKNPPPTNGFKASSAVLGPIATIAAKAVFDYVKGELEKEAERYQAQFSKTALLSTEDVRHGGYLVLTRWVDSRSLSAEGVGLDTDAYQALTNAFFTAPLNESTSLIPFPYVPPVDSITELKGKQLAFMFVARLEPFNPGHRSSAFKLEPHYIWAWQSKAKVVDFDWAESWKVWKVLGTLIFKTDNQVHYKIEPQIKALAQTTNGLVMVAAVSPSEDPIVTQNHNLDTPKQYFLNDRSGALVGIPSFENIDEEPIGYFSVRLTVHESDNSNVRKLLLKGAEQIDKNSDSWADKVSSMFGEQ